MLPGIEYRFKRKNTEKPDKQWLTLTIQIAGWPLRFAWSFFERGVRNRYRAYLPLIWVDKHRVGGLLLQPFTGHCHIAGQHVDGRSRTIPVGIECRLDVVTLTGQRLPTLARQCASVRHLPVIHPHYVQQSNGRRSPAILVCLWSTKTGHICRVWLFPESDRVKTQLVWQPTNASVRPVRRAGASPIWARFDFQCYDNYVSEIVLRTWCIYTRRHLDYIIYGINIYMFISPVILCYNYIVFVGQY